MPTPMPPPGNTDEAFKNLTDRVVELAEEVNIARDRMQGFMKAGRVIYTNGTRSTTAGPDGVSIRDYEKELEKLKEAIKNDPSNRELEHDILGRKHYIRALEVEFDHKDESKDYRITGVVLRGLISVSPNDGNQEPNYSSKSSSSMVR